MNTKRLICTVLGIVIGLGLYAQDYKIQGKTITSVKVEKAKAEPVNTGYTVQENGKEYPVYVGSTGSCYIIKISKNGNEYKKYLGAEVSQEICKAINHEYKPKQSR